MGTLSFKSVKEVMEFVDDANKLNGDINVYAGRYIVDGKSAMGMCSICHLKNVRAELVSADQTDVHHFNTMCRRYSA